MKKFDDSNSIHPTALISEYVVLGKFNKIGANVVIEGFNGGCNTVSIGDCNIINDNTRILAGEGGISIGDWNVFHNSMLVMGEKKMAIGHNCWFGQNTIVDSSGELVIGNGVRVGMYSQIWTHVASGELIEGCTLYSNRKTVIEDDVWLVGSCIVSSGVTLGQRCIFLIGSNVTKSTEPNKVYAGNPAKLLKGLNFYKPITITEKFDLMIGWVADFVQQNPEIKFKVNDEQIEIVNSVSFEKIVFVKNGYYDNDKSSSVFNLSTKRYSKTLSELEQRFYKFIYNHKARFLPE